MRRVFRWLFTILSGVSLLLCAAVAVSWCRRGGVTDRVVWESVWEEEGGW